MLLYAEVNIFPLAVLVLIFFYMKNRTDPQLFEQKLFAGLLYIDALIIILDTVMWVMDGQPGVAGRWLHAGSTVLYYILNPVMCLMWYYYVDYYIHRDTARFKKRLVPMLIPALISGILSVVSLFGNVLFYIDDSNVYHRGTFFLFMAGISVFYLFYTMVLTVIRQKRLRKQDFMPIAFFMIPPLIGGVIQTLFYGVSLIWPCVTLSILIIFITIQNNQLHTDYLTGLFNRRQLDRYLQNKLQTHSDGILAGLMVDLDSFKRINDQYGHQMGDQALIDTSEILKKTFRKNDFISRFGGDEFVIIVPVQDKTDLHKAIDRLNENVAAFNQHKTVPYTISLSVGYDCFLDKSDQSAKDFIQHLDDLMYQNKQHGNKK